MASLCCALFVLTFLYISSLCWRETRPSHGRVCSSLHPPEARQKFLLAGLFYCYYGIFLAVSTSVSKKKHHRIRMNNHGGNPLFSCRFSRLGFTFFLCGVEEVSFAHMGEKQIGPFFAQKRFFSSPPEGVLRQKMGFRAGFCAFTHGFWGVRFFYARLEQKGEFPPCELWR